MSATALSTSAATDAEGGRLSFSQRMDVFFAFISVPLFFCPSYNSNSTSQLVTDELTWKNLNTSCWVPGTKTACQVIYTNTQNLSKSIGNKVIIIDKESLIKLFYASPFSHTPDINAGEVIEVTFNAMFHVTHWRIFQTAIVITAILFVILAVPLCEARADVADTEMAQRIASLLGEKFSPDSLAVTVRESRAYAEMRGVVISGIRIDSMKLNALLTNNQAVLSDDVDALTALIGYSKGELILLEDDVNAYFDANEKSGFSNLHFDFSPSGFKANGLFSADFIFTLRIRLAANGILGLRPDGVYLENVVIRVENVRQPDALTNQIISRVNPLLEFSDIPFKVEFDTVAMDDSSAKMSGSPEAITGGSTAIWKRRSDS
jgi:hypothetical protein